MVGLIDCNSFYASCERVFRPDLRGKPIVVLSNNDGCIVAQSEEAKKMGIARGAPYHQNRAFLERQGAAVFSSNYALYQDISNRVMETVRRNVHAMEVYSIDEAFLFFSPRRISPEPGKALPPPEGGGGTVHGNPRLPWDREEQNPGQSGGAVQQAERRRFHPDRREGRGDPGPNGGFRGMGDRTAEGGFSYGKRYSDGPRSYPPGGLVD